MTSSKFLKCTPDPVMLTMEFGFSNILLIGLMKVLDTKYNDVWRKKRGK